MPERANHHGFSQEAYKNNWRIRLQQSAAEQEIPYKYQVRSIFCAKADIIRENPTLAKFSYTFDDMSGRFDMGMQVLGAIHLGPDCEQFVKINLSCLPPPIISPQHSSTVGSPALCKWFTDEEQLELMKRLAQATPQAEIQASFGRRYDQDYIAPCRVSVEHGAEAYADFIGQMRRSLRRYSSES